MELTALVVGLAMTLFGEILKKYFFVNDPKITIGAMAVIFGIVGALISPEQAAKIAAFVVSASTIATGAYEYMKSISGKQ